MPRQRHHYPIVESAFPDDFPECLERFMKAAGLSPSELARRIGVSTNTVKRWMTGVRPTSEHLIALQEFADDLNLGHLLPLGRDRRPRLPGF